MSLTRNHLQLLAAIARYGRLGDAARALRLSPSAASHRLVEAEKRLGTTLTVPHGRTIRLTDAGRHLARAAGEIERDWKRAELTARWIGSGEPVRMRVAVGSYDTAGWLIDTFAPDPDLPRIELLRFSDRGLLDGVRSGHADLAVAPWPVPPSGVRNVLLYEDVLAAAVPTGTDLAGRDALSADEVYDETFLTSGYEPRRGFEFHEFFLESGVIPETAIQVQSLEMILRLVGAGYGVTIQPSLVLAWNRPHRDVTVVPLAGPPIDVRWMATSRTDADSNVEATAARIAGAFERAAATAET